MQSAPARILIAMAAVLPLLPGGAPAQGRAPAPAYEPSLYDGLRYRLVGPHRGGRATTVEGVPGQPFTFYMGSTGGGVWRTTDAGQSWQPLSDGSFEAGSIGDVAVSLSDPNVIYVGTGSDAPRGNVSQGVGMYRSTDAGRSWEHAGLRDAGQIGEVVIHPTNPDLVYAAALGHVFGPNPERGVFRTRDGGQSWERVLFVSDSTGAIDLEMDPSNPRVLYAAMWRAERKPWTMISGGREGGIYKSTDAGDTWTKLTNGLPAGVIGKIGIAVSPARPDRVWALVEAEGKRQGFYRSDDAGATWTIVNDSEPRLWMRPWYYQHVVAHPTDENTVYSVNDDFFVSYDGGQSWEEMQTPHGDNHDLWINPNHPEIWVESNDGGVNVSLNGGKTWSTQMNQPTAELYRVTVDEQFPYRIYAAQQDNSTISLPSRTTDGGITMQHWITAGGGESGHIAVDPRNPDILYAGTYDGLITRLDRATGQRRNIKAWPELQTGQAVRDLRYRFQWNAPIRLSPHDPRILYHASQVVHRTTNEGQSWEVISPDLTRNDRSKQGYAGEPITRDISGVEVYGSIFALEESPHAAGELWAGSDDGLVHLSRDHGKSWTNITPRGMPEGTVNTIEISPHRPGRAIMAVHRYRFDDFRPYVYRTDDYGKSWTLLTDGKNGIPAGHFVRVVREDPDREGLLYAGTEYGMYVSFDGGRRWQPFQLNLPATPITDLKVHRKDLVVATQGRSLWILDDLSPLHQLSPEAADAPVHLFQPRDAHRIEGEGRSRGRGTFVGDEAHGGTFLEGWTGENPPVGAIFYYRVGEGVEGPVRLEILDERGEVVETFSSEKEDGPSAEPGMHRFAWNLHYPGAEVVEGAVFEGHEYGIPAVPGTYQVRLTAGDRSQTRSFRVLKDPRIAATREDLQAQFDLMLAVRDKITEAHDAVRTIRAVREQVDQLAARLQDAPEGPAVRERADALRARLDSLEDRLHQKRSVTGQDPLNYPARLDDQIAFISRLVVSSATRPTDQAYARFEELKPQLAALLAELQTVLDSEVAGFNAMLRDRGVAAVVVPR